MGQKIKLGNGRLWRKSHIVLFLNSILTALAVTMNMNVPDTPEAGINHSLYAGIYKIIDKISLDLSDKGLLLTILTIFAYTVYRKVWMEKQTEAIKYSKALSLFLAVMYTAGIGFSYANSLSILYNSSIRIMKTAILIAGFYVLYLTAINSLYIALKSRRDIVLPENKIILLYKKHSWLSLWLGIMGCWLIHILLRYPGVMSYDNWNQLAYYFGYKDFTTAQPLFHTWLFSIFIEFGLWLGNANIGLFLFTIFQSLIMSAILSWSLLLMKKWKSPVWLRILTMSIYCIAPYYAGYVSFPIKDFLYTAFFLLFVLYIMEWTEDSSLFYSKKSRIIGWIITVSLLILFRKNGIYIYIPVALAITFSEIKRLSENKRKPFNCHSTILFITMLVLPLFIIKGTESIIMYSYQVEKDSVKEALSLPFQQTARYVRDYGEEITPKEKEAIANVLDYDRLPSLYLEMTADPVKTTFHAEAAGDLADYFKIWFQQFLKHPLCYIEATWNQSYYVFSPNIDNIVYNKDCNIGEEIMTETGLLEHINFEVPSQMQGICTIMVSYYSLLSRLPVIGMLNNVAFYIILMFVICIFMMHEKQKRAPFIMIPLFISFLIILAAPQIQGQPRYAFPIIYAMPTVTAFYKRFN